jgi:hypothetical protein
MRSAALGALLGATLGVLIVLICSAVLTLWDGAPPVVPSDASPPDADEVDECPAGVCGPLMCNFHHVTTMG